MVQTERERERRQGNVKSEKEEDGSEGVITTQTHISWLLPCCIILLCLVTIFSSVLPKPHNKAQLFYVNIIIVTVVVHTITISSWSPSSHNIKEMEWKWFL